MLILVIDGDGAGADGSYSPCATRCDRIRSNRLSISWFILLAIAYLIWVLFALVAYSLVPPLIKLATTGNPGMSTNVVLVITNRILLVATGLLVVVADENVLASLSHQ
jgi:uncharacterized protein with PQ loop repeat